MKLRSVYVLHIPNCWLTAINKRMYPIKSESGCAVAYYWLQAPVRCTLRSRNKRFIKFFGIFGNWKFETRNWDLVTFFLCHCTFKFAWIIVGNSVRSADWRWGHWALALVDLVLWLGFPKQSPSIDIPDCSNEDKETAKRQYDSSHFLRYALNPLQLHCSSKCRMLLWNRLKRKELIYNCFKLWSYLYNVQTVSYLWQFLYLGGRIWNETSRFPMSNEMSWWWCIRIT